MNLDDAYTLVTENWSDLQANIPALEQHVKDTEAKTIIELGVRSGVSTIVFLNALRGTGGEVWSVDTNWPHGPFTALLGGSPNWHFVHGNDLHQGVFAQLPDEADIVFVDTVHSFGHTLQELRAYYSRVRFGGRILLHDTNLEEPETAPGETDYPVLRAVREFTANTMLFENDTAGYGLGCVYA